MYNPITEDKIKQAPQILDIDVSRLPQTLTDTFAEIASFRRMITESDNLDFSSLISIKFKLKKLANNLETFVVAMPNAEHRKSAAFVAATAHHLIFQIQEIIEPDLNEVEHLSANAVSPLISAMMLFLISNNPSDAIEIGKKIRSTEAKTSITYELIIILRELASGDLRVLVENHNAVFEREIGDTDEEKALNLLWLTIVEGVIVLAEELIGEPSDDSAHSIFLKVIDLAKETISFEIEDFSTVFLFSGIHHLATLLLILSDDLLDRGIINVPPPKGIDHMKWSDSLVNFANDRPYLWNNHLEAISSGLLDPGISAVLTFPTGAGKSTLAELKIASTLLDGKTIIYIVPTHALEDQVKKSLQDRFVGFRIDQSLEIDSEFSEIIPDALPPILVCTPERCLALIGIDHGMFRNVGLVIFDEFHLIHSKEEGGDRRSIDAMLCLLQLFTYLEKSDYLLISAMVENGEEIASWIESVLGRPCINFSSNWKPTRQLQGCIVFEETEIESLKEILEKHKATQISGGKKSPSSIVKKKMLATPYSIFSLLNRWDSVDTRDYKIVNIISRGVLLGVNSFFKLTANRNQIAADIASIYAAKNIKTLIFVDNPRIAVSTANKVKSNFKSLGVENRNEYDGDQQLIATIKDELGGESYGYFALDGNVSIHHGLMLPTERALSERMFRRKKGVRVMIATPTLAQGINLPAELVVIAGDERFDISTGRMEKLEAHELLNAAGRAGRAGFVSQGMVIVIPGKIATIRENNITQRWWELKNDVFSKSDQCLKIDDPIQYIIDKIHSQFSPDDDIQKYFLNRVNFGEEDDGSKIRSFLGRSFTAYRERKETKWEEFQAKVESVIMQRSSVNEKGTYEAWIERISGNLGLDANLIADISDSIDNLGFDSCFNFSISDWVEWICDWLAFDSNRILVFWGKDYAWSNLCKAMGLKPETASIEEVLKNLGRIKLLTKNWVKGEPLMILESLIVQKEDPKLKHARNFAIRFIPDFCFVFGVFSLIVREKVDQSGNDEILVPLRLRVLATCIREGVDSVEKLGYRYKNRYLSRVQVHRKMPEESNKIEMSSIEGFQELIEFIEESKFGLDN